MNYHQNRSVDKARSRIRILSVKDDDRLKVYDNIPNLPKIQLRENSGRYQPQAISHNVHPNQHRSNKQQYQLPQEDIARFRQRQYAEQQNHNKHPIQTPIMAICTIQPSPVVNNNQQSITRQQSIKYQAQIAQQNNNQPLVSQQRQRLSQSLYETCTKAMTYYCTKCNNNITENSIHLVCCHIYHEQCLLDLCKEQVKQGQPILHCVCNRRIATSVLRNIGGSTAKQILNNLFHRQAKMCAQNAIQQLLLFKCSDPQCEYLYADTKKQNTYCPLCLLNRTGLTFKSKSINK